MYLDNNSLIMQWNTDTNGNPVSRHIPREVQQVSPTHNLIQLTQIPDEFYPLRIITEDNIELSEVKHRNDIAEDSFSVDYGLGLVYFHESLKGKMIIINYYGRGVMLISDSRIFHRDGDTIADTWDNIIERSQDALDLIEHAGGLSNAIKVIDEKVEEGTQVADRLENFITETQFYGYTITLSREAFVVKADESGDVRKTEISSVYTDVVVYKGAKQIVPILTVSNEQGCSFKVEGQRVKLTSMNINFIKTNAVLNIDCGDGLVAQRVLEVTKVFDGVNQYQVSMTNPFYSFQANSEGFIEEDQTVTCSLKVTKANIEYENYQIQVQNAPQGLNYKINKDSVTFTGVQGRLLPSSGTCLVVVTIDGRAYNNSFSWNKVRKGVDAKTLKLVGSQIIRYETPDFSDIPAQRQTTISAKISGLSGTPTWSFFDGTEWAVLQNVTGTELTFEHNDQIIWSNRKEVTIKCELEGYSDEITIVKLANGVNGNDAITVVLTNESHTVPIDDSGVVAKSEIDNSRTTVLAYRGTKSIMPRVTKGRCVGCDIEITQDVVQLISLDNSFTSSTAELIIEVEGVITTKVWTISKSRQGQQGQSGQNGSTLILNVTGGTRSVAYSQINHDPRPSTSSTFVATLYVDGVEISDGLSWYWVASGHFEGTSILGTFTPTIRRIFDESVISNNISVTVTYKGQTITQEVPLSVTKDANGLDWVQEWDDTKTDVRGNLILTPKIFAGSYDQENDLVTGVAVGQDVLNNDRTVGIVGYQNNIPSFLLDTDGSLQVGNPFQENSTGLYYSNGVFKLKVNELSIEGSKVPTENEVSGLITSEVNSAKNELEASINGLSDSLGSLEDVLNNGLQDGILTEVEKQSLKIKLDTLKGESTTLTAQIGSVLVSPYLSNTALLLKLEELSENYETTYNALLDVYDRITESDTPTDEDVALFNETLYNLRELSEELNQVLIDCLTDISQTQATQLVDRAKEEIKAEVDDVNNALTDLEDTINGDFKVGLVTSINLANLENHLHQLAKEKADIDAQYTIIFNNKNLSNAIKQKLLQAKSDYDIIHDALVAKINSAIADNLMTEQELKEINTLIKTYTIKLGAYSGVAQEANADIALRTAQGVVEALDQEAIFNKLTNNGEVQGIYLQDGKVYINGEYINSRNLKAVRNDGTETFKIDSEGNIHIKASSFYLVGDSVNSNIPDKDYVDSAIESVATGSVNVMLSNEAQVIATSNSRVPFSNQTFSTKVGVYMGSTEVKDFTIGAVSSANGISVSVNQSTKTINFSVSTETTITADNGSFTIPVSFNGNTYSKKWTWAVSKQGNTGATGAQGAGAKTVDIIASSQVFKSTDGGLTFSPTTIKLTPKLQNVTYSNWQYSTNGGNSWTNVVSGEKGMSIDSSNKALTVSKDSSAYTDTVTSVVFRVNTSDTTVYDTVTIVKLYDVADLEIGGRNLARKGSIAKYGSGSTDTTVNDANFTTDGSATISRTAVTNEGAMIDRYVVYDGGANYVVTFKMRTTSGTVNSIHFYNGRGHKNSKVYIDGAYKGTMGQDLTFPNDANYHKVEVQFEAVATDSSIANAQNTQHIIPQPMKGTASAYTIQILNLKIEKGNKATDWTPAPEDVKNHAEQSAQDAVNAQTQNSIFNKLTNNGETQGIYLENSKIYINGEYIKANTLSADKVLVGDYTNYCQLTEQTPMSDKFNKYTHSDGTIWHEMKTINRDTRISRDYSCKGGEKFRVTGYVYGKVTSMTASGGSTSQENTKFRVGIFGTKTDGSKFYYCGDDNTGSSTGSVVQFSKIVTLPSDAKSFHVVLHLDGWTPMSGVARCRNIEVRRMNTGELIVDGSITANHITSRSITADRIKAGAITANEIAAGTITADKINANVLSASTIVSTINGGSTNISGNKIRTGTIQSNNGKSTINLDNGSMNLGTTSDASYLQWTGSALNIKANSINIGTSSVATTTQLTEKINGVNNSISSLTTRMSSAESKITDTAITNVVKQNFYTKTETNNQITSKGYQTASQVQQTVDNLQIKFTQSGGYNLFLNSGFKRGTNYWLTHTYNNPTGGSIGTLSSAAEWGFPDSSVNCVQIRLSNQSSKEYGIKQTVKTTTGKKYTISFYYAGHRLSHANVIVRQSGGGGWLINKDITSFPSGGNSNISNWNKHSVTFTANGTTHDINIVIVSANNDGYFWVAQPQVVEGEIELPYSPHPNEVYDGITQIDKDGIKVSTSKGAYTHFSADGMNSYDNSGVQTLGIRNGGLTIHNGGEYVGFISQSQMSNAGLNGISIANANQGEYIAFGWDNNATNPNAGFNHTHILTIYKDNYSGINGTKGVNMFDNLNMQDKNISNVWTHYVNGSLRMKDNATLLFDSTATYPSAIWEDISSGNLAVFGDNGVVLGYKNGNTNTNMFKITETADGKGCKINSYQHWNFNDWTMHNMQATYNGFSRTGADYVKMFKSSSSSESNFCVELANDYVTYFNIQANNYADGGKYIARFHYWNGTSASSQGIHFYRALNMHGYNITNVGNMNVFALATEEVVANDIKIVLPYAVASRNGEVESLSVVKSTDDVTEHNDSVTIINGRAEVYLPIGLAHMGYLVHVTPNKLVKVAVTDKLDDYFVIEVDSDEEVEVDYCIKAFQPNYTTRVATYGELQGEESPQATIAEEVGECDEVQYFNEIAPLDYMGGDSPTVE